MATGETSLSSFGKRKTVGSMRSKVLGLVTLAMTSCVPQGPSPSDVARAGEYGDEQIACILEAGAGLHCADDSGNMIDSGECVAARIKADKCRCAVKVNFGQRPCHE
jgi:hypothetical protein